MPSKFTNLTPSRARLERHFEDGSSLFIEYRPTRVTPRQIHQADAIRAIGFENLPPAEQTKQIDETTQMLANCLIAWDLLDANDQPIPCTLEGLQDVDLETQTAILELIMEDRRMGKVSANGQSPGLSTPTSALPQMNGSGSQESMNGISTSLSPIGSE
jgi:hypothetical protein